MADDPLFDAPPQNDQFETAILCALGFESSAVEQLFDEVWYDDQIKKHPKDRNTYTTGSIDERLVVLAWMHGIGKAKAASVAGDLRFSFDNIKHIFVVGVCGGLPKSTEDQDILLGDIIISTHLQKYDEGKQYPTGYLAGGKCNPDRETLPFLTKLKESSHTQERLLTLCVKNLKDKFGGNKHRPGPQDDRLYQSQYLHKHYDKSCQVCNISSPDSVCDAARTLNCDELQCGNSHLVERKRLRSILKTPSDEGKKYPIIHIGAIGSGDTVMKSGNHRDRVAKQEQVIAFEMEGAGVYEQIGSVVVIKAVCDYADSHKNKQWQRYAAMTAAACTKAFLLMRSGGQSWRARAREILHPVSGFG
ncbi:purine and uridine phosphorylase [Lojkania enalia]|uniref:Purine and uridine phosphorylase n=1 Tax=Lojkania enalia TaxID=147567 RepID=A0A9P4MUY5_9PLEO|nr:purine and uridine phosphorylase [Didymosphaeria enalia]